MSVKSTSGTESAGAQAVPEGETEIEYIGVSTAAQVYRGAVTKQERKFGGARRRGSVDNRDVPGYLALRQNRSQIFRLAEPLAEETAPDSELEPVE